MQNLSDNSMKESPQVSASYKTFGEIWKESSKQKKVGIVFASIFLTIPVGGYHLIRYGIPSLARWTFKHILRPIGKTIEKILQAVFITFPTFFYRNVLAPIGRVIKKIAIWTYDVILSPILSIVKKIIIAFFISIPIFIYGNALVPASNYLRERRRWTQEQIITPVIVTITDFFAETIPAAFNAIKRKFSAA